MNCSRCYILSSLAFLEISCFRITCSKLKKPLQSLHRAIPWLTDSQNIITKSVTRGWYSDYCVACPYRVYFWLNIAKNCLFWIILFVIIQFTMTAPAGKQHSACGSLGYCRSFQRLFPIKKHIYKNLNELWYVLSCFFCLRNASLTYQSSNCTRQKVWAPKVPI